MPPSLPPFQVNGLRKEHRPPVPLATLDMQKRVTRELRMPGEAIMKIAEELYQGGFISYPRTETDGFSPDYDLLVRAALREASGLSSSHTYHSPVQQQVLIRRHRHWLCIACGWE